MNLIKDKTRNEVIRLLGEGADFMLYRLPGRTPKLVTARKPKVDVRIIPWNTHLSDAIVPDDTAEATFELPSETPEQYYLESLEKIISRLKQRGRAKTVISRVIAGCNPECDWVDIADCLWQKYPDTFGYLFYTSGTGGWVGATPEKLLFTFSPDTFTTCALAGTLPTDVEWNRKNYDEQQMVADFIKDTLTRLGLRFEENGPRTLRYGAIKHLMTNFRGVMDNPEMQIPVLLDSLAPTPALAGLPREDALADIADTELHRRGCYGGYIYVGDDTRVYTFVTIRCAQFDPRDGRWAVYAGGGITPASVPADEWAETCAKSDTLVRLIRKEVPE
ncbi:MAG: chorismate-binding protein [Muribaculaceae bacterium]|nr:chorismate-binding protein [Muribaculaceae bacterium]